MKLNDVVTVDFEILHGTLFFKGSPVPVQSLFWHLEQGTSLDESLEDLFLRTATLGPPSVVSLPFAF